MSQPPIVVDLGKQKKKKIKDLKKGRGRTYDEVLETIDQVKESVGAEANGKQFVPVVVVYKKKRKKSKNRLPFPF